MSLRKGKLKLTSHTHNISAAEVTNCAGPWGSLVTSLATPKQTHGLPLPRASAAMGIRLSEPAVPLAGVLPLLQTFGSPTLHGLSTCLPRRHGINSCMLMSLWQQTQCCMYRLLFNHLELIPAHQGLQCCQGPYCCWSRCTGVPKAKGQLRKAENFSVPSKHQLQGGCAAAFWFSYFQSVLW